MITGPNDIDPREVLKTLGIDEPTAIEPVHGGADTAIWRVEQGGEAFALRVFHPQQDMTCKREVAAMSAATEAGVPVPKIFAQGTWQDRPTLLLSWCKGRPIAEILRRQPWRAWHLGVIFGRMQAVIHVVGAPPELCTEPHGWIGWAGPGEDALQAWLRALELQADTLLHLDYHMLNVLTDGRSITGVLDWANAQAGDPRADCARSWTILRLMPWGPMGPPVATPLVRRVLERGWRHGYEQVAGPLRDLDLFKIWAGAVMARDLAPYVGRPGSWVTQQHIEQIRRWTHAYKRRVGLPTS